MDRQERQNARDILFAFNNGKLINIADVHGRPLTTERIIDAFYLLAVQGGSIADKRYLREAIIDQRPNGRKGVKQRGSILELLCQNNDFSSRLLGLARLEKPIAHFTLRMIADRVNSDLVPYEKWKSIVHTLAKSNQTSAHNTLIAVFKKFGCDRRLGFMVRDATNDMEALFLYGHSSYRNTSAKLVAVTHRGVAYFGGPDLFGEVENYCRRHRVSEKADNQAWVHAFEESVELLRTNKGPARIFDTDVIPGAHRDRNLSNVPCDRFSAREGLITEHPNSVPMHRALTKNALTQALHRAMRIPSMVTNVLR
ncbi:MAG TPA: hypothetical protein PKB15_07035 [Acidimicrobiia bacterium]|nr:hypothetical protein [Acidimicrobiia bacterium]